MGGILVFICDRALGGALHAGPILEALRKTTPDSRIGLVTTEFLRPIFAANPYVDEIFAVPDPAANYVRALFVLGLRYKTIRGYYSVAVFSRGSSARRYFAMAQLFGIRTSYSFREAGPSATCLAYDQAKSVVRNNLEIVEKITGKTCNKYAKLRVFYSEHDNHTAHELLMAGAKPSVDAIVIGIISQPSGGEPNAWFDDRFKKLGHILLAKYNAKLVFFGSASQTAAIENIISEFHEKSISLAGRTDLGVLAACIARCDLVISIDTGPMHIATALDIPMIVIANAARPRHEWLPSETATRRILRADGISCALCRRYSCETRECMQEITVDEVTRAVTQVLTRASSV